MIETENIGGKTGGTEKTALEPVLIRLKVLPMIRERQQQHGLRHGDYQRYHGYCSRRVRRLRETLKMPQGDRRHFKKKPVTLAELDSEKGDSRYLEIPLTLSERAWAFAMALKQDANTETRKKFHLISRLQKARVHAAELVDLATGSVRVDARTKLECEAYSAFIAATFFFELQQWPEAIEAFKKAQSIYSQIAQALEEHPEAVTYTEKMTELLPSLRFCAYQTGAELDISELASQFQSAAIEAMIAQKPKMSEVMFRGNKITVPTEKLAALLVRIDDFEKKSEKKVQMYEDILIDLRDAIQTVREANKVEQSVGGKSKPTMLLSYLLYLRLTLTNSRTLLMFQEKTQPKDRIRLVEMILHNFQEMLTIPFMDQDEDFLTEVDDMASVFKGVRCRYIADIYQNAKRWSETVSLYGKSQEMLTRALKGLPSNSPFATIVKETEEHIKSSLLICRAQAILSEANETGDGEGSRKLSRPKEPLQDRLESYVLDESLLSGEPNVAQFPPAFRPIPCKPLFFDLALNHIKMPEKLEENAGLSPKKSQNKEAGITGFVKGLWGWGK